MNSIKWSGEGEKGEAKCLNLIVTTDISVLKTKYSFFGVLTIHPYSFTSYSERKKIY